MTIHQKAKAIIKESIKSAIYIDEKAFEPYTDLPSSNNMEVQLSKKLYSNFKKEGVSLAVHKFNFSDIENQKCIDFLFKRRDLVLLDWKLDDSDGEIYSLKLLSKIIREKHIHFCSIYTSQDDTEEIINNISTFFSGKDESFYTKIKENLDVYYDEYKDIFEKISIIDLSINNKLYQEFKLIDDDLPETIKSVTDERNFGAALISVKYAFSNYYKSSEINPIPTHINRSNCTLNINNTIITIISKNQNSAKLILNKLISQISKSDNNFTQLLGLDMQNNFANNSSFIDENLLNTNLNTLMYHRKQLVSHDLHKEFNRFMMSILLEQARITLEDSKLEILDNEFLDKITRKSSSKIKQEEIAILNSFYNGSCLSLKNKLGFGDIFIDQNNDYYLCITALCDCELHNGISNIGFRYFFVKGFKTSLDIGIEKGDGGFISYVDNICISWTNGEYVKPIQLYVPRPHFDNNEIEFLDWDSDNETNVNKISYMFTLKQNYAQRIANHSFAHPVRVGVDFVKGK